MIQIGKYAKLEVVKEVDFGVYLDGGPYGELLLPTNAVPEGIRPGDEIEVFVYADSEDRLITTTDVPNAIVDEFALMEVKEVNEYGAFLDWGIKGKDLMVPFRNQRDRMEAGQKYLVFVYLDETTERIVATNKLNKFLKEKNEDLEPNQEVEIIIVKPSDLGYRVIVNQKYWAALYKNEVFRPLEIGDKLNGFVKNIREDQRIDVSLQQQGGGETDRAMHQVLDALKSNDGFLPLTDKSPPEKIYTLLKMSKKNFKRAVGGLYKRRMIYMEEKGIRISEPS